MMHKIKKLSLLLVMLLFTVATSVRATHIVGGEVAYTCLGGDQYLVTISIYRDCIGGKVGAIAEDDPALITVFTPQGLAYQSDQIYALKTNGEVIPPNFKNECVSNPPPTCLNKIVFQKQYYLPGGPSGYKILYQNCCRNGSVMNIINPANTGATYFCTIPPISAGKCNNSAIFKNFPPQIICVNNPLKYDHGAYDPDGDSLSYEFCMSYDSPEKQNKKYPSFIFDPVTYRAPYNSANPMGGNPKISIDPKTGMISGTPNVQGRYVVAVCCHEWRNGVIINTSTREFQFVVANCSKAVVANIPQYSTDYNTYIVNCKDYTVTFDNLSTGGSTYYWDFGVPGVDNDTSHEFNPTFTYPDSGIYVVTLYVNKGTTCSDSISRFVKVYPKLISKFSAPSRICPGDTVQFLDSSTSTYNITNWVWNFGDNSDLNNEQNPKHVFIYGGLYNVGLVAINSQGCLDTSFRKILVDPLSPNLGKDTNIVVGERIFFEGQDIGQYLWTPSKFLSATNIRNPIGTFTEEGTFTYFVKVLTEQGCTSYDTFKVRVLGSAVNAVPNMFTPNGDGNNDLFRPILVGYSSMEIFKVFNRYGEEMYSTQTIGEGWDGTFKGQEQEMGTYFWLLKVKDPKGNSKIYKGDINLIR